MTMPTGSELVKHLNGKQIGFVTIRKAVEHTNSSYECAAWYKSMRSDCGVFPLFLGAACRVGSILRAGGLSLARALADQQRKPD